MPAPRPIRLTTKEHAWLVFCYEASLHQWTPLDDVILAKLKAAVEEAPPGVNSSALERALERGAPGKVARLMGPGYGRASKRAGQLGATEEQVEMVGKWAARWWSRGSLTLLDVLAKWDTWLPKALKEQPPPSLRQGLQNGASDTRQGTAPERPASPPGRIKSGLG